MRQRVLLFGGWQIWISKEIWHQCLKTNIFPIASILVFFFLEFVQLQQRQLLLLLCQSRLELVRLQLVLEYHTVFDRGRSGRPHPYYWNLPRPWNSWFHRRNIPEDIARWEKGLDQTLIKARFFYVEEDYCNDFSMMNAVPLRRRCLKNSHHMQNPCAKYPSKCS